jgi:hypothetical protein
MARRLNYFVPQGLRWITQPIFGYIFDKKILNLDTEHLKQVRSLYGEAVLAQLLFGTRSSSTVPVHRMLLVVRGTCIAEKLCVILHNRGVLTDFPLFPPSPFSSISPRPRCSA